MARQFLLLPGICLLLLGAFVGRRSFAAGLEVDLSHIVLVTPEGFVAVVVGDQSTYLEQPTGTIIHVARPPLAIIKLTESIPEVQYSTLGRQGNVALSIARLAVARNNFVNFGPRVANAILRDRPTRVSDTMGQTRASLRVDPLTGLISKVLPPIERMPISGLNLNRGLTFGLGWSHGPSGARLTLSSISQVPPVFSPQILNFLPPMRLAPGPRPAAESLPAADSLPARETGVDIRCLQELGRANAYHKFELLEKPGEIRLSDFARKVLHTTADDVGSLVYKQTGTAPPTELQRMLLFRWRTSH